jgi:N-acyl homoserine lactone hydrolase
VDDVPPPGEQSGQRYQQELCPRNEDDYTIREWVDAPGMRYVPVDGELDEPDSEGQLVVRALDPELVWLAHEREPWRPGTG